MFLPQPLVFDLLIPLLLQLPLFEINLYALSLDRLEPLDTELLAFLINRAEQLQAVRSPLIGIILRETIAQRGVALAMP